MNCHAPAPSADAEVAAGPAQAGTWVLPGGRALTPAGRLLPIGNFPLSVRALPAPYTHHVVVSNGGDGDDSLVIVDASAQGAGAITSTVLYADTDGTPQSPALFYGLQVGQKGAVRVFASGGGYDVNKPDDPRGPIHVVDVFTVAGATPALQREHRLLVTAGPNGARYPAGLTLSSDEKVLYVVGQQDASLTLFDVDSASPSWGRQLGSIEGLGSYPYDVAIDDTLHRAYVSLWGGELLSSVPGMPPRFRDGLIAVDVSQPAQPRRINDPGLDTLLATGKGSEQLLASGRRLLVAAADADRVTALDLDQVSSPLAVRLADPVQNLIGASPSALALDEGRQRIYVTTSNDNALVVLSAKDLSLLGRIPTAAYPTGVAVLGDGTVVVTCAKGIGAYPTSQRPPDGNNYFGLLEVIDRPSDQDLAAGQTQVAKNNDRPMSYQATPACDGATAIAGPSPDRRFPLPLQPGDPTPIKHVFLVVKENKTYDAYLGDQPGTRGQPDLAIFGGNISPNHHALASEFASLDNFYVDSDASIQGHEWTTTAFSNDFTEKAWLTTWGRGSRPESTFGGTVTSDYAAGGPAGSVFEALDRAGVSYHNYGEVVNAASAQVKFDVQYPGVIFTLDVADEDRARYLVDRLNDPGQTIETFHYILLPDDHTYGTSPGKLTPQAMVSDNDAGLGMFIDGLSHSPYWQDSVVFVIEDDPSDGADHIDQRRSICLAIGPWIKRHHVSSVNYDFPGLWRTIELLLGIPPLNRLDGTSPAMYDLFAETPDLTPYTMRPRQIADTVSQRDAPMAAESMAIDFSRPDTAPLGEILWRAMRGTAPPFPTSLRRRDRDDD